MLDKLPAIQAQQPVLDERRCVCQMIRAELRPPSGEPASEYAGALEQLEFQKGLLLLSCGRSTIRFAPPLVIGRDEVDVGLRIFVECLTELDGRFGARHP